MSEVSDLNVDLAEWELIASDECGGDPWWIVVPEHSASNRFRALRDVASEVGHDWRDLRARQSWMRTHALTECGWKAREALTDEQRDRLDAWQWNGIDELPAEFVLADEGCWCSEWDGNGVEGCKRSDYGARPAYEVTVKALNRER